MTEQSLESLCTINPETLGSATPADFEFRYVDISAVEEGRIDWSATRIFKFADAPSRARRQLRVGDALLCTVRPMLKAHARIEKASSLPLVASTGFAVLRPRLMSDAGFLFHQLFSESITAQLRARETGSNYPAVNEGDVKQLRLYTPQPSERHRIAEVLDGVDAAISRTEEVIAKIKDVRTGLLHDLLTRGLDKHGQLRDPVACPEQFQDSRFGQFPKEWTVETLAGLLASGVIADIQDGNHGELHPKESDYVEEGIPFVMAADIAENSFAIDHCKRIPFELYKRLRIGHAFPGDVLLSHKASVGFVARLAVEHGPIMLTPQVTYYRIGKKERLDSEYLQWFMRGQFFQSQLQSLAAQSTRDYVGITAQKSISMMLPSRIDEQKAIVDLIATVQGSLGTNDAMVTKHRMIRSGLMGDLLTGGVRLPEAFTTQGAFL